jgi:hypothetical protein
MGNQYKEIKLKNILREAFSKYDTPLEDLPKKKMGTTWFQYWMKPGMGKSGWEWFVGDYDGNLKQNPIKIPGRKEEWSRWVNTLRDKGLFIWISRPGSKKPTAKYEIDTGLLQGHWVDDMEYQW